MRFGSLEGIYANVDAVPGDKRRETLIEHRDGRRALEAAGDDRARPRRSTSTSARRSPTRPTGRRWASCSGASSSARCCAASTSWRRPSRGAAIEREEHAVGAERGDAAALAALLAAGGPIGVAGDGGGLLAVARGEQALLVAEADADARARRRATRRSSRTTSSRSAGALCEAGVVPAFDTELAAYLIDPGRSEYDLDDLLAEQGLGRRRAPTATATPCWRAAPRAPLLPARAAGRPHRRARAPTAAGGHRAAARRRAVRDGARRRRDRLGAHGRDRRAGLRAGRGARAAAPTELAGEPFALGSPKQLGEVLFERLGLPGGPQGQDRLLDRLQGAREDPRPAPDRAPSSRSGASSRSCSRPTSLPFRDAARRGRPPAHDVLAGRRPRPAGSRRSARTCRTSRSARRSGARSARPSSPREGTRLLSADYSQVELRILAHLSGEELLREAFARGEDIHARDRRRGARQAERDELSKDERDRAKAVNFGIIYGISRTACPSSSGSSATRRRPTSTPTAGACRASPRSSSARSHDARERGYAVTLLGPPPAGARAARAELDRCARSASGWPSTR